MLREKPVTKERTPCDIPDMTAESDAQRQEVGGGARVGGLEEEGVQWGQSFSLGRWEVLGTVRGDGDTAL